MTFANETAHPQVKQPIECFVEADARSDDPDNVVLRGKPVLQVDDEIGDRSLGHKNRLYSPSLSRVHQVRAFLIAWTIWVVRFCVDGLCARLQVVIELMLRATVRRTVRVSHHEYGKGWREVVDIITASDQVALHDHSKPAIVYVHGGGWMIVSKDLMRPYVTYMARKGGFRVFNADYPLSPETKFPTALISMLRLLHWMHATHHVDRVILMGDSAGANMCALVGMLLAHPEFLQQLAIYSKNKEISSWSYPRIVRNVLFYGLFDEDTLNATRTSAAYICREVLNLHRRNDVFDGRCTPMDFAHQYMDARFPRTCIVTGMLCPRNFPPFPTLLLLFVCLFVCCCCCRCCFMRCFLLTTCAALFRNC